MEITARVNNPSNLKLTMMYWPCVREQGAAVSTLSATKQLAELNTVDEAPSHVGKY